MIAPLLCGMMLILTLMRIAVPIGQPVAGNLLGVVPLRFRERIRLQRTNVYLLGVMLLLGTLGGWIRTPINLIVVLATFVIVSIPVQYTFTTEGIARNRVVFRHWDEFDRHRRRARAHPPPRHRGCGELHTPARGRSARRWRNDLLAQTPLGMPKPRTPPPLPARANEANTKTSEAATA